MKKFIPGFLLLIFLYAFFSFQSCKKDDKTDDPIIPTLVDTADPVQYETPFAGIPSTPDIVMYEINERAFSNTGTFSGILPRLDSIKALGVNVIWLMPIHPIGVINTVNSPYCVKNYKKVNPEFGTLEDLRILVRESHNRGMAVILDWVANHTSWDNPWIKNKAWYTQNSYSEIISPAGTNWKDVADLNYDNTEMRKEMIKAMKYWVLTANVDGYRCDAADMVPFDFWKQAIDSLEYIPGHEIIMLAEGARKDHFAAGFRMNFSWDFMTKCKQVLTASLSPSSLYQTHLDEYEGIPAGGEKLRFTSNHDICAWEGTPLDQFGGKEASMAAFAATLFMGGVPLIYNGQEVGCPVKLPFFSRSPINWTTNPDMAAEYRFLLAVRNAHAALRNGDLSFFPDDNVVAFKRNLANEEVVVMINIRDKASVVSLPTGLQTTSWKDARTGQDVFLDKQLNFNAFEYFILLK